MPGCRRIDNVVYAEYQPVDESGWNPITVYGFSPWPMDSIYSTSDRYNLEVCVRFNRLRGNPELNMLVRQFFADGGEKADTLRMRLSDRGDGMKCAHGICEVTETIATGIPIEEGYFVEMQSLTPADRSRGLINVGMRMSETGPR